MTEETNEAQLDEDKTHIRKYLQEFSSESNEWFHGKRNILPIVKEYYSFHKNFFTKENLENATWEQFQEISKKMHSLRSVPMAGKNAFGKPNVPIEEYRKQFLALLDKQIPVKERVDNFKLPFIGKATIRELMGYIYPEDCYIINSSTEIALNFLGIKVNIPRGASIGEEYEALTKELDKIQTLYKSIVGHKTDLPVNLEIDQFLRWITETQASTTEVKYWAVGCTWDGDSKESHFLEQGIWEDGYGANGNNKYKKELEQVSVGAFLLLKSSSTNGKGHRISFTKLKKVGKVTAINEWYSFSVEWLDIQGLPKDFDGIYYAKTIEQMRNDKMLQFVKNALTGAPQNSSYTIENTESKHPLNQILYGPPGTGKTYSTVIKAMEIINNASYPTLSKEEYTRLKKQFDELKLKGQIKFITFHQNYSYEEFIEGIRPELQSGSNNLCYALTNGPLKQIQEKAKKDPNNKYVLIIDEINRGNISKIFGELITLLEADKRKGNEHEITMPLMYSQEEFFLPNNLYIIGTMNTADKSIALVDVALRRRFSFTEMMPNEELVPENISEVLLREIFITLNKKISIYRDRDHQLGHSYFMNIQNLPQLKQKWFKEILPLLNEYFYGDWEKLNSVLSERFITNTEDISFKETIGESWTFKSEKEMGDEQFIKEINGIAKLNQ
ncbi:MAG: AAA family ATPase [Elusimicrobiota bacterium]|jgi:hypothetical protein|nr:AAA family ATPase [Elusimicrobiota bacterium]